jgi:hypothetical protein
LDGGRAAIVAPVHVLAGVALDTGSGGRVAAEWQREMEDGVA